jgi:hypothetical protein
MELFSIRIQRTFQLVSTPYDYLFDNSPAHRLFLLFSNDAKLGRVLSGKYVDDRYGLFCYIAEYQEIKIPLKNYFEWYKWLCRKIYWNITGYRNIPSISLANFWLGILGKSETGSLYLDL